MKKLFVVNEIGSLGKGSSIVEVDMDTMKMVDKTEKVLSMLEIEETPSLEVEVEIDSKEELTEKDLLALLNDQIKKDVANKEFSVNEYQEKLLREKIDF